MATKKTSASPAPQATHAEIEERARQIYEERIKKNLPGNAESDWLAAEKELAKKKR